MPPFGQMVLDVTSKGISSCRIETKSYLSHNISFGHGLSTAQGEAKVGQWMPPGLGIDFQGGTSTRGKDAMLTTKYLVQTNGPIQELCKRGRATKRANLEFSRHNHLKQDFKILSPNPDSQLGVDFSKDRFRHFVKSKKRACNAVLSPRGWQSVKFFRAGKDSRSNFTFGALTDDQEALKREEETGIELVDTTGPDDAKGRSQVRIVRRRGQILGTYAVNTAIAIQDLLPPEGFVVLMSCGVGLVTGVCVVLFNLAVHEVHDIVWEGIPKTGAAWLRTQTIESTWKHIVLVPVGGGVVVGILNTIRAALQGTSEEKSMWGNATKFLRQILKTGAAAITLGTGSSLGPEGPSVEIGASIANGLTTVLRNSRERKLSFVAAGSAAGISSGFNAAVSGCFFAVESVLPGLSTGDAATSLTTAMVLLSSVLASVVSQAGLGSDPTFRIPAYEFRSPTELPLYLLLGILCGGVSVAFTKGSSFANTVFKSLQKGTGLPDGFLPPLGGLCVGIIAIAYPEVLYWGFENVDVLLESTWPWVQGPSAVLLLQLVGAKLVATCICRGSGLVGGIYAPALFIGAALGSAYGSLASYASIQADPMWHLDVLDVAAPQAYALVGMAAVLAGVCQVPLTSVLLLFELTRDYRIILPLMAAVGLSSWVASVFQRKNSQVVFQPEPAASTGTMISESQSLQMGDAIKRINTESQYPTAMPINGRPSRNNELCNLEDTLCLSTVEINEENLTGEISVRTAMRTRYAAVIGDTSVREAMSKMLAEKEWCVMIIDQENRLEGLITLADIQQEAEKARLSGLQTELETRSISSICGSVSAGGQIKLVTAYPEMTLKTAQRLMAGRGLRQIPVVAHNSVGQEENRGKVVLGLLDREGIKLACRTEATRRMLRYQGATMVQSVADGTSLPQ